MKLCDAEENFKKTLIGESPEIRELAKLIEKIKDVDSTVLVLGESGTGKEVVARTLHHSSARKDKHFGTINCSAIPENLLEAELFGHTKGAFTDAKTDRKGIFELCDGGTLLLDEIGDMPLNLQSKILRVLQEKQFSPVGSNEVFDVNTRVIAATNRDIVEEVKNKNFREDLYFRLSVVVVRIPPLRHRKQDIPLLLNFFLEEFNKHFDKTVQCPPKLLEKFMDYDWPGNIRELKNSIERGVILATNDQMKMEDVFQHLLFSENEQRREKDLQHNKFSVSEDIFHLPLTEAKQEFEKTYVMNLLKSCDGNISEVARRSNRYRSDIYRLIERYELNKINTSYMF